MNKYLFSVLFFLMFFIGEVNAQVTDPTPCGPVPSENQMRWQEMGYYAFVHFSLNTYTNQSWGFGNEDVKLFNPTKADCRQWVRVCKEAGMKGIIITAKHHCGFCLWPSKYTEYSVKNAPWKNGKGDMIRELADACKEYGLKLGIYLSPWDRNRSDYGRPEYIKYYRDQLTELLTNYGPIFEVWFDGANGGSGYYGGANETRIIDPKTYYDWQNTFKLIHKLQPKCAIWNDGGDRGDMRWVGTEEGNVGETNWSLLDSTGEVTWEMLHYGLKNGNKWVPAEVNTSIRPEWFYHPSEDDKVKTVPQLMDIYYSSIGRNGSLLLNFPITPDGLIHANDAKAAIEFAKVVKKSFAKNLAENKKIKASNVRGNLRKYGADNVIDKDDITYWATDDSVKSASLTINFDRPTLFNRFLVQENIRLGQRVESFTVEALVNGVWKKLAQATTIGYKRILRFPEVKATQVRFNILSSKACPVISNIGIYNAPVFLSAPNIIRDQNGNVTINTDDIGPIFYYTTDGSIPTKKSNRYDKPFLADGKVYIKAIAYDPASGKHSPVSNEDFDISEKNWSIVGTNDKRADLIIDGDPLTAWHQNDNKMPIDVVINLGNEYEICGFKYLPDQNRWSSGVITGYQFFVSSDNKNWEMVDKGEFSNIKNNPSMQIKNFTPVKAHYVKFRALKNTVGDNVAGYAEVSVITK